LRFPANDFASELLHRTPGSLARQTVLVVGVKGFIGAAVACRLHAAGARVIGVSRSPPKSAVPLRHVRLDIARATDPAACHPLIDGIIDAVVYCAGALRMARRVPAGRA
jgi:nucleoside-diphosphate-sugar epimerase